MTPRFPSDLGDPGRAGGHATDLTRMSELVAFTGGRFGAKRPTLLEMPRLARCVHRFAPVMLIVVGTLLLAGCPPPPLSLDEPDARLNSPPGINSVRRDTGDEFKIGQDNSAIIGEGSMTLTLEDSDLDDTLYVRVFRNYNVTIHPSASVVCNVGPSTPRSTERSVTCSLNAYCIAVETVTMDIIVSDRLPDDAGEGDPPYLTVEDPGRQATRTFQVTCQDPTS